MPSVRLTVRRIGNSLGLIVPRKVLSAWGIGEGDFLELTPNAIRPRRPRRPGHAQLDELKRAISAEVISRFRPEEIRARALENLARWREAGVWCGAYDEWLEILRSGDDARLYAAMVGRTGEANRLRQSMPYVGMLPKDVLEVLREEAAA
jgi:antitoxin component of MazEF toxin-antitoxin module